MNISESRIVSMVLAGIAVLFSGAHAQNSIQSAEPALAGVSADRVITIFASAGLSAQVVGAEETSQTLQFNTSNGLIGYVVLRGCENAAPSAPCGLVQTFMIYNNSGLSTSQLNEYNFKFSNMSTAMIMDDGRTLLGVKHLVRGGVTESNVRYVLAAFFEDNANLVEYGQSTQSAAEVSFSGYGFKGVAPVEVRELSLFEGADSNVFGGQTVASYKAISNLMKKAFGE
jgi:hypothetical protein